MVVFNIVLLVVSLVPTERADMLDLWLSVIGVGLCVFFGARANQMAIDRYLARAGNSPVRGRDRFPT